MRLGYNTNGLAHHDFRGAVEVVATLGYESIAITLDHACLNPLAPHFDRELADAKVLLGEHRLRSVIETGARYLLDPLHKHEPTLLAPDSSARRQRQEFLRRALDAAAVLGSDCVSLWSGILPSQTSRAEGMDRLVEELHDLLSYAADCGVMLGFEPEPGMLVDTLACFQELSARLDHPHFGLTLDVGHLQCTGETPIAERIREWRSRLVNVHLEDIRGTVHDHLMFGEGELDFPPILAALSAKSATMADYT
jgi:L-ribulose-5-phosphate 3-epimerase